MCPNPISPARRPRYGPFARSEDRAHKRHPGMAPDAFRERWHEGGQHLYHTEVGRVCIITSPVRLAMSIPYLFTKWPKSSLGTFLKRKRETSCCSCLNARTQ